MFSFNEGIAGDLAFRLIPAAGPLRQPSSSDDETESSTMERALPSTDVKESDFTDAYVDFIFYCNPQFPRRTVTEQLTSKFNGMPKSEGREFKTWDLFGLMRRYNAKEIDTWASLALELGVEPPDLDKGQSIQKVQQYTVRLKRWMRAMHIDAFFDYLFGKPHDYYLKIPPADDPYPAEGRDGIPTEEDLVIRSLDPSFRPKRGRRRNSEIERMEEASRGPRSAAPITFEHEPGSAYPHSDIPSSAHPLGRQHDPWSSLGRGLNWQEPQSAITPSISAMRWGQIDVLPSPHPMSAMPGSSSAAQLEAAYEDEPQSAITPSTKKRRKHGPAVSSRWPTQSHPGSRPRGRPPAARIAEDGPYNAFPASSGEAEAGPATSRSVEPLRHPSESSSVEMPPPSSITPQRPGRLSLQVPQRTGGNVRLATPPRSVADVSAPSVASEGRSLTRTPEPQQRTSFPQPASIFTYEQLRRTLASDLLRADLLGRPIRLTGDEAKRLADAILDRLKVPRPGGDEMSDQVARLTAASWLGLGDHLNMPLGPALGQKKTIRVTRFRSDAEGYEELVPADDPAMTDVRQIFDLRWTATQGTCQGGFELIGLLLVEGGKDKDDIDNIHDFVVGTIQREAKRVTKLEDLGAFEQRAAMNYQKYAPGIQREFGIAGVDEDNVDWKTKYRIVEFGASLGHGEFDRFKAMMLQKVIDLFL